MSSEELLLTIDPLELKFPFEIKKKISSSFQLLNKTDNHVAFKVKTNMPRKYSVRPNNGMVQPRSTCAVVVTMQAQKEAHPDMQCNDIFLVRGVVANQGATSKDINEEMYDKEAGKHVQEFRVKVIYVTPPKPPSPVHQESVEGSPLMSIVSESAHPNHSDAVPREHMEAHDCSTEAKTRYLKLAEERNRALEQNKKLSQELKLLKRGQVKLTEERNYALEQNQRLSRELELLKCRPVSLAEERNYALGKNQRLSREEEFLLYGERLDLEEEWFRALDLNKILSRELELLKRGKMSGRMSMLYVMLIGLIGILLGYYIRS